MCICAWRDLRREDADNESAGESNESVRPIPRVEYPSGKPNNPIWPLAKPITTEEVLS